MNHVQGLNYQVPGYNRSRKNRHAAANKSHEICGSICNAGTDFIEILTQHHTRTMIMKEQIKHIDFIDCSCSHFRWHDDMSHCDDLDHCDDCQCDESSEMVCDCEDCHHHQHSCCDGAIPVCDERIQLRLAGLDNSLNFKFFMLKGCKVCIELHE